MKILHVTSDWKWTGPAEPMLHAASGLRARGHGVDVAFPSSPPEEPGGIDEHARERGLAPVLELERQRGFRPLRDRGEIARLRRTIESGGYDLVHVHHTRDHLLARAAIGRRRARLVASWHQGTPVPGWPWSRWLYGPRGSDGLTVLSTDLADSARRALGGAPGRVSVLPGVVDTERFAPRSPPASVRASLGVPADARVVGVVARLQPHRRFELLLEAFRRACAVAPGLRLVVVGRGTRAAEVLERPVERLGLEGAVVQAGYREGDFRDVVASFDALAFLVPGSDGSCRAVLEAMALGIPTLATRRGLLPEIVVDGVTGRLTDEEPDAWAEALLEVWRDPEVCSARGKAARERAVERYAVPLHAERLERFYASLLAPSP